MLLSSLLFGIAGILLETVLELIFANHMILIRCCLVRIIFGGLFSFNNEIIIISFGNVTSWFTILILRRLTMPTVQKNVGFLFEIM